MLIYCSSAPHHPLAGLLYDKSIPLLMGNQAPYIDLYEIEGSQDKGWVVQDQKFDYALPHNRAFPLQCYAINGNYFPGFSDNVSIFCLQQVTMSPVSKIIFNC